ncbi:MAG: DUF6273 domain-containing protein [Bariatricus sp.]
MAKKLSSLAAGTLIKDTGTTYNGEIIVWRILEHGHSGDPSGTTALEARDIISLKCFDAKESGNSDSNRKSYGNNRYLHSNILQWLNSDASAGSWYSAKHSADAAPTNGNVYSNYNEYDQEAGFLTNFSENLRDALKTVSKTTAKNTVTDGGGSETVQSKIFLLSTTEVGLANENSIAEGSIYEYYSNNNSNSGRVKKPTSQCVSKSEYTNSNLNTSSGWYWWLRTPYSGNSFYVRCVYADGSLDYNNAYYGHDGVSPAYVISSDTLVSDSPDSDGAYTIQWNASPQIEPATKALGSVTAAPSQSITITDTDGDSFTGVVKLDGTQKATFSGTASLEYTLPIDDMWSDMSLAAHTITVEVTDSAGNTSTGTYTLTKTNSTPGAPTITNISDNRRIGTESYVEFQLQEDPEGDIQTPVAEVASKSDFSDKKTYTALQKYENGAWTDITSVETSNVVNPMRIYIGDRTEGETVYIRIGTTDEGTKQTVYSDAVKVRVGTILEITTKPIVQSDMPTVCSVFYKGTIDNNATAALYACNNANDEEPTWELVSGNHHAFTNAAKTAESWAVAAKIVINANDAIGDINITSIAVGLM